MEEKRTLLTEHEIAIWDVIHTSPANAAFSLERLLEKWKRISQETRKEQRH